MISTLELVNIAAKKAGIKETQAKFFFELLIKRLAEKLKPGETVKFSDIGFFHLRLIEKEIENIRDLNEKSKTEKQSVLLFSKSLEQKAYIENHIKFNVHKIPDEKHNEIDSYFSLSIGKPVFPFEGTANDELFAQEAGIELRKSLLYRADQLVGAMEKIKNTGDECIDFNKSLSAKEEETVVKDVKDSDEAEDLGDDLSTSEEKRISARNFVEDISNQVKDEQKLEKEKKEKPKAADDGLSEKLPWNFGRNVFDIKVDYKRDDAEEPVNKNVKENISEEVENDEPAIKPEDSFNTGFDEENINVDTKKDLSEKDIEHDEKLKSILDDYITKNEPEKFGAFERVKSFVSNIKKEDKIDEPVDESSVEAVENEVTPVEDIKTDEDFVQVQSKSTEYHYEDELEKIKKKKEPVKEKEPKKKDKHLYIRKKRSAVPVMVAVIAILFVAAIIYLYLNSDTFFKSDGLADDSLPDERPSSVTVIDREYVFPVTYPYKPVTNNEITGINLSMFSDEKIVFKPPVPRQELENKQDEKPVVEESKNSSGEESIGSVGKNVYKYKEYYVVQVASFQVYSMAEEEAKIYEDMGYNAFVEIAEITDKGTWFRLRVGDFTTRDKAISFAQKYTK